MAGTGEANLGANVGIGTGLVFRNKTGVTLNFKSLIGGSNITITDNANDITIDAATAGEANTISNVGSGVGEVFKQKVGVNFELKTILAGTGINVKNNSSDVEIENTGIVSGSNVGLGVGKIFKQILGGDIELKSLLSTSEIVFTNLTDEISALVGAIAQSKVTGLVTALDSKIETITNIGGASEIAKAKVGVNVDMRTLLANAEILITTNVSDLAFSIGAIAQSKITDLVTDLGTKIDTIVNVGTGAGLVFRDKVGTTLNLKTILAGTGIDVTNNADDIEISVESDLKASGIYNTYDGEQPSDTEFLAVVGIALKSGIESSRQTIIPNAMTARRLSVEISANPSGFATNVNLRINGATGNLSAVVGAGLTGSFQDLSNTDSLSNTDLINYQILLNGGSAITFVSASTQVEI